MEPLIFCEQLFCPGLGIGECVRERENEHDEV